MRNLIAVFLLLFCCAFAQGQNNISKTAGVNYTSGVPTVAPSRVSGSEYAIDTITGYFYQFHRTGSVGGTWHLLGQGIEVWPTFGVPTNIPTRNISRFSINTGDSLYRRVGAVWNCINCFAGGGGGVTELNGLTGIVDITGAGINIVTLFGQTITVTGTEIDGSITNELQTIANTSDATSHTATLSNSGGSFKAVEGTGIGLATTGTGLDGIVTVTNTGDLSNTNEIQRLDTFTIVSNILRASLLNDAVPFSSVDLSPYLGTGTVESVAATAPAAGFTITGSPITTTGTFVFALANDLAALEAMAGTGMVARTAANTYAQRTITAGTGAITVTNGDGVAGNPTVNNTDPDQSISNELQTFANTSNATSHTVTLSNAGGSTQFVEGTGVTLTTTGTAGDGVVTIASTAGTNYQTWRDDGTPATARPNANFVTTATIAMTLTDDAGNTETEVTANVVANSIGNTQLRQGLARSVIGVTGNATANVADIQGTADQVLRVTTAGTALAFGTVATGGITDQAVTYVKLQNAVSNNVLLGNNNGANTSYEEINPAAAQTMLGYVDGAGANQHIAYWTDANTISGEGAFLYDAANDRQTIICTTPTLGAGLAILNISNVGTDVNGEFLQMRGNMSGNMIAGQQNSNSSASANTFYQISQTGNSSGDAFVQFNISADGGTSASIGIDNSDVNKIKITPNATWPGANANASFVGTNDAVPLWGINTDAPAHPLDVNGVARAIQLRNTNVWQNADIAFGTGAGTGPTINSISGGNNGFQLNFTTGTVPAANGIIFTATYPNPFGVLSYPVPWGRGAPGGVNFLNEMAKFNVDSAGAGSFVIKANGTITASTQYAINFVIMGY